MKKKNVTDMEREFALALLRKPPEVRECVVNDAVPEPITQPALMEREGNPDE